MIEPIEIKVALDAGQKGAFTMFVANMDAWWPVASHSVAQGTVVFGQGVGRHIEETAASGEVHVWAHVTNWCEFEQISLSWYPGGTPDTGTHVTIDFAPSVDGNSEVTLTHSGWGVFGEKALEKRSNYKQGWAHILRECYFEHVKQVRGEVTHDTPDHMPDHMRDE